MSIHLTIMRPEPITQQEFEDLIQGDPELDFASLHNKAMASYKDFELSFGMGSICIPYTEAMTDADIGKFIAIASKLNGRLFSEAGSKFYRTPQETYKDEAFFEACQEKSQIFVKKPMKLFTRKEFLFVGGGLALLAVFFLFIIYGYWQRYWYIVVIPLILLYIWSWVKDWLILWRTKRRADVCEKNIADEMKQFLDRLCQLAGQEKVFLILPDWMSPYSRTKLNVLTEALKNNVIVKKKFPLGDGTIVTPRSIAKINAEIQKNWTCRTVIFFNALSWKYAREELETLDIIKNSMGNPPQIVVFQLQESAWYVKFKAAPPTALPELISDGKITAALFMHIEKCCGKKDESYPQKLTAYSFGMSKLPDRVHFIDPEDLAQFNRKYKEYGFDSAVGWADAKSKGTGFRSLPVYLRLDAFEIWPEKMNAAGIKTTVRTIDLYLCCRRSLEAGGFDGLKLTVDFKDNLYCLLLFLKQPLPNSGKVEACFYSESTELLAALKTAKLGAAIS